MASQWTPLPNLAHGKVVKPFLPLDTHPNLKLSAFYKNLYYGDEVFLFESNGKWARGYQIIQPLPADFIAKSSDLEKLQEMQVSVVILPLSHVNITETFPLISNFSPPDLSDFESLNASVPTVYELQVSNSKARNGDFVDDTVSARLKPPLPLVRLDSGELLDELTPSLSQLSSHIYSLYSVAEYPLFDKLSNLFNELNDIRIKLAHDLFTNNEKLMAKKQVYLLLTNISKLLSSKGINRFGSTNSATLKNDSSGFESITARDVNTGELYHAFDPNESNQPDPQVIATSQITAALQPNFPVKSTLEQDIQHKKITKFDKITPSQILVDFKSVSGTSVLNPKGFVGLTAYLFLRSAKKRLTEAFSIYINGDSDFSLEKISAAMFRNIPGTEIDNGRIYLVAIITEKIEVQPNTENEHVTAIRRGIAAGVADISRIFSRHQGALETGESHQFTIKLFGSYVNKTDNTLLDPKNMNFGWGELIDRIIAGSKKGVAVNPRAERLVVSIKEFRDDLANVAQDFDANVKTPIYQIRTNFFDPLVKAYDRVYFSLGRVIYKNSTAPFPGELMSVSLVRDNPKSKIGISKATNEIPGAQWDFTSVHSNEVIGETIKLSNIEDISANETLTLKLYVNFEYRGSTQVHVSQNGKVYEYNKNQLITFHNDAGGAEGTVEITTNYIGKTYNIDSAFQHVLSWRRLYSLPEHEERLIETLKIVNQAPLEKDIKLYKEILFELLYIFNTAVSLKLPKLKAASFYAFIHSLDVVIARQEQYTYLHHDFVQEAKKKSAVLPCGADLLFMTATYFDKASSEWNYVGRTLCRILPLLVEISYVDNLNSDEKELKSAWKALVQTLIPFIRLKVEAMIPDQLLVVEYFDVILGYLKQHFTEAETVGFVIALIESANSRKLALDDPSALVKKEKHFHITKLFLIRRLLESWIFADTACNESSEEFFCSAVGWAIETYMAPSIDVETLRIANSCLISLCKVAWKIIINKEESNYIIPRAVSRLLLTVAKLFVKMHEYGRANQLFEPKRIYTNIFPNAFPFPELITDSIVNDIILVEILVELAVVYSFITKIAKRVAGDGQGFITILQDSKDDYQFNIMNENFLESFTKDGLLSIIQTNRLLIQSKFMPAEKWISLFALFIEGATAASELIKPIMIGEHIPPPEQSEDFDRQLWSRYLKSLLAMGGSRPASICHLAEVPRKAAWKITQDIRSRCATVVDEAWDSLGWDALKGDLVRFNMKKMTGYQVEFIQEDYGILEELVVFCLQRNSFCQIVGVKVLWSIMISELLVQESNEDRMPGARLIDVEKGCLLGLERFLKSGKYFPGLYEQRNFIKRLKMVVRLDAEDESFPDVYSFIQNLGDFLDVLNDLTSVPEGEEYDDERTFHNLDILRHLMRVNNSKKFNSSLDDMYLANLSKSNYVQAALCLELMASIYDWNVDEILPISIKPKFPEQSAFERKESLYKQIAENLIKGHKLEKAVLTLKELAEAYDKVNFNLQGLSFVHNQLSRLYTQLEALDRQTPTYFLVSFIGLGFPRTVRSRSFIYEGLPFEQINSIHNRLQRLHAGSKIISDDEAQRAMQTPPTGKFLHIVTVKPQMDFTSNHGDLSTAARMYMQNKDLRYFSTSRRLQKSTSVLDLWVEEITYETYNVFPTLMNRSEISNVHTMKLSPIQNALRTLSTKTQDLVNGETAAALALKSGDLKSSIFNDLSRNLSGTVDSPVNGGIGQYKEFFKDEVDPEDDHAANERSLLKSAFDNLTIVIFRCLLVHGKIVPDTLRDSHSALIRLFEKNFADEIVRTGLNVQDLDNAFPALSKVPSLSSTLAGSNGSQYNGVYGSTPSPKTYSSGTRVNSVTTASSMIASLTHGLSRVDTKSSEKSDGSSGKSMSTKTSNITGAQTSRKRSILNWRQSRQPQ